MRAVFAFLFVIVGVQCLPLTRPAVNEIQTGTPLVQIILNIIQKTETDASPVLPPLLPEIPLAPMPIEPEIPVINFPAVPETPIGVLPAEPEAPIANLPAEPEAPVLIVPDEPVAPIAPVPDVPIDTNPSEPMPMPPSSNPGGFPEFPFIPFKPT